MESETASSPNAKGRTGLAGRDNVVSLFQPDTLVLAQFFDDRRGKTLIEPEVKLMLAILEDAIQCFQDNVSSKHSSRKRLFDDVQRWIFEVKDDWVFSFENICSVLGFNSEYVRKGLVRWREKELSTGRVAPI
jgi:hypothetical protein